MQGRPSGACFFVHCHVASGHCSVYLLAVSSCFSRHITILLITGFFRASNTFVNILFIKAVSFCASAVSNLKSLTAGRHKCNVLNLKDLSTKLSARQYFVEEIIRYIVEANFSVSFHLPKVCGLPAFTSYLPKVGSEHFPQEIRIDFSEPPELFRTESVAFAQYTGQFEPVLDAEFRRVLPLKLL